MLNEDKTELRIINNILISYFDLGDVAIGDVLLLLLFKKDKEGKQKKNCVSTLRKFFYFYKD